MNETFSFYVSMLEERKAEISRELEQAYSNKQVALTVYSQKAQETVDKIFQVDNLNIGWSTFDISQFFTLVFLNSVWSAV